MALLNQIEMSKKNKKPVKNPKPVKIKKPILQNYIEKIKLAKSQRFSDTEKLGTNSVR